MLQLFASAYERASVGLLVLDAGLRPVVANAYLRRLHGHEGRAFVRGEFPGRAELHDLEGAALPPSHSLLAEVVERGRLEPRVLRVRDEVTGRLNPVLVAGERLDDAGGQLLGLVLTMVDSTDRLRSEARLQQLATTDELTGLLNRRGLLHHGEALLARLRSERAVAALWVLDVVGLKPVNDVHGHAEGDRLLQVVARAAVRAAPSALVARLGGDEFCVLGPVDALLPERLEVALVALSAEVGLLSPAVVTVGRAEVRDPADDLLVLIGRADAAMYRQRGLR